MLGLGTLALLRHPDQLAMIRDDPARIEPAVEELLRWLSIAQLLPPRTTTMDVEIAGHAIPAGSLVICSLPAANRDPALALADPYEQVDFRVFSAVYGLHSLRVTW